jgi:DnaJ-class molecular chaperone
MEPPKPTMATGRQTRLQFRRQTKKDAPPTATPPITTLLSQYELLVSLCQHLSSADIIHLGVTSKEHWQYVSGSPKLLKALIGNSSCDGTGIIAQARVFGHWNADPSQATRKCRGREAEPCHDCGAMVCNVATSQCTLPSSLDHH